MNYLEVGESRKLGDLRIGVLDENIIYVTGQSKARRIEDMTEKKVLDELNSLKTELRSIIDGSSIELKNFIAGKTIKFNLAYNYGMGSVEICHEVNGVIYWNPYLDIKK
jgi:hypothetical protein